MKKTLLLIVVLAFAVAAAYGQYSQPSSNATQSAADSKAGPPLKTIAGTISADGKTFTADKGGETWTLKNPEDVKGHEGHHVKLNAHVYQDSKELHVMKVTMMKDKSAKK